MRHITTAHNEKALTPTENKRKENYLPNTKSASKSRLCLYSPNSGPVSDYVSVLTTASPSTQHVHTTWMQMQTDHLLPLSLLLVLFLKPLLSFTFHLQGFLPGFHLSEC